MFIQPNSNSTTHGSLPRPRFHFSGPSIANNRDAQSHVLLRATLEYNCPRTAHQEAASTANDRRKTNFKDSRQTHHSAHLCRCGTISARVSFTVRANHVPMAAGSILRRECSCDGRGFEWTLKSLPKRLSTGSPSTFLARSLHVLRRVSDESSFDEKLTLNCEMNDASTSSKMVLACGGVRRFDASRSCAGQCGASIFGRSGGR